jgi:hypothetical protein
MLKGRTTVQYRPPVLSVWWESDANGDAEALMEVTGRITTIVTNPDIGAAPTDNYDVTLTDQHGHDVLAGLVVNRDTAASEAVRIWRASPATDRHQATYIVHDVIRLVIANAGDSKRGSVHVFLAE